MRVTVAAASSAAVYVCARVHACACVCIYILWVVGCGTFEHRMRIQSNSPFFVLLNVMFFVVVDDGGSQALNFPPVLYPIRELSLDVSP